MQLSETLYPGWNRARAPRQCSTSICCTRARTCSLNAWSVGGRFVTRIHVVGAPGAPGAPAGGGGGGDANGYIDRSGTRRRSTSVFHCDRLDILGRQQEACACPRSEHNDGRCLLQAVPGNTRLLHVDAELRKCRTRLLAARHSISRHQTDTLQSLHSWEQRIDSTVAASAHRTGTPTIRRHTGRGISLQTSRMSSTLSSCAS